MNDDESGSPTAERGPERRAASEPVTDGLRDLAEGRAPRLELARGAHEWIEATHLPDGVYRLAHRRPEDPDTHELYTGDPVLLRDICFAWIDRDPWWRERVAWSRVDPAVAELESVRGELTDFLDGFGLLDSLTGELDDAMARADDLLALHADLDGD
ncbi:hypothetical protein ACWEKT_00925 [Nocardia takedensis]